MSSSKDEIMEVLWNSADLMRDLVSVRDSRNYILGMLIIKKLSEDPNNTILER